MFVSCICFITSDWVFAGDLVVSYCSTSYDFDVDSLDVGSGDKICNRSENVIEKIYSNEEIHKTSLKK